MKDDTTGMLGADDIRFQPSGNVVPISLPRPAKQVKTKTAATKHQNKMLASGEIPFAGSGSPDTKAESQATTIVQLATDAGATLFHTTVGDA